MTHIAALAARLTLGPDWLRFAVKLFARNGRLGQAHALLDDMLKTVGDPTSDSTANRNTRVDRAHVNIARAEIALAAGRAEEAVEPLEAAAQIDAESSDTIESLATGYLAAGRVDEAARAYERVIAGLELDTEAQPGWFDAHLRLADIRLRQGNPEAARALYEKVIAIWKDGDRDLIPLQEARKGLAGIK